MPSDLNVASIYRENPKNKGLCMNRKLFWLALFIYPLTAFANDVSPNACIRTHESVHASSLKVTTCLLRSKPDADPTTVDTVRVTLENISLRPIEVALAEHILFFGLAIRHDDLKKRVQSPNSIPLMKSEQRYQVLELGQRVDRKVSFNAFFEGGNRMYAKSAVRVSPLVSFRFTDLPNQAAIDGFVENGSAAYRNSDKHIARFDDVNVRVPK
jgi:hypothetical protein